MRVSCEIHIMILLQTESQYEMAGNVERLHVVQCNSMRGKSQGRGQYTPIYKWSHQSTNKIDL